ncbi:MAG: hypothetical protein MUF10_15235 [Thermoanaerobaculaceae bacterium]|jgi:hypothetical protein|nr:hypothetical protein [Thermoanaerobaculaceae bacterium]
MRRALWSLALSLLSTVPAQAATPAVPYAWPARPEQGMLDRARATPSDSGLVVLERRGRIDIRSFGVKPMGVKREELVRMLVVNEAGVRNAQLDVTGDEQAGIEVLEGRTVAADGTVTAVDEKRDIKRLDVVGRRRTDPIVSLATVSFPAAAVGSVLEAHFVTNIEGEVYEFLQPLGFASTPSLGSELDLTIASGPLFKVQWASMTTGDTTGAASIEYKGSGAIAVHVKALNPGKPEPYGLPDWHRLPMLLVYLDFGGLRTETAPVGVAYQSSAYVDPRGMVRSAFFPTALHREFWGKYLQEEVKAADEFLKSPGDAAGIGILTIAPASMPLGERLAALYTATQENLSYNPDADKVDTLSGLMSKGMAYRSHGSLLLAYLLKRSTIPYQLAWVVNRRSLRFSPVFRSEFIYGFQLAVVVDVPDRGPVYMMPGYLDIPFGSLPEAYQESLAFYPAGEKDVSYKTTPLSQKGVDRATMTCDLKLDAAGDAAGTLQLAEVGVPGEPFARWYRWRQFRNAHPTREDKKVGEGDRKQELETAIEDELTVPGSKLQLTNRRIKAAPVRAGEPLELAADVTAKGLAEPAGDRWLVFAHPLLAGFSSPFTAERRTEPIWYGSAGRMVLDGTLALPAGAAVVELPQPVKLDGPGGVSATSFVEKVEKDGVTAIHSRVEMDVPLAVGRDQYEAWRTYQAAVAKLGQDRCIITLAGEKVLE